jgi:hypothetical protein
MSLFALVAVISTVTFVGGWPFFLAVWILALFYYEVTRVYGQTGRDMQRLGTRSTSLTLLYLLMLHRFSVTFSIIFCLRRSNHRCCNYKGTWGVEHVHV